MPNNIFLTGVPGSGKSTIIKNVVRQLNLIPGGFSVGREGSPGLWTTFFLREAAQLLIEKTGNIITDKVVDQVTNKVQKINKFAWREDGSSRWQIETSVFDRCGVEILKKGLQSRLVIMDELGRFELTALEFQKEVESVLSSNIPVLGVLKDEDNPFLNRLRRREDLTLFQVDIKNREARYKQVLQLMTTLCSG